MHRIVHIRRNLERQGGDLRYDIIDAGRYGGEAGAADVERSLTAERVGDWLAREGFSFTSIRQILSELAEEGSVQVQAPPRIGPRIVRAWFDTVLNPLIDSVDLELGLISKRNWTYSFGSRTLELIQPVRRRFDNANLEQILQMTADLGANIDRHDDAAITLRDAVAALHDALVANPEFVQLCDSLLSAERLRELGARDRSYIFGAYPTSDHDSLIAQYIVNSTGELPPHYTTAKFWNRNREVLLGCLISLPDVRERVVPVGSAAERLSSISRTLDAQLKNLRQELSLRYDAPIIRGYRNKRTA